MKNDFEENLKKLFDYQKFEENPKLNQIIKDADSSFGLISDLELAKVSSGAKQGNIGVGIKDCEKCGAKKSIIVIPGKSAFYEVCSSCGYIKSNKFNNII